VLIAEHQTGGPGRFERSWEDVPGASVAMSVLLKPEAPLERWGWLSLVAGMSVCAALRRIAGIPASEPGSTSRIGLKWPNDVLVNGKKICGVLAQAAPPAVVLGIGLNVAQRADQLPVLTATSMLEAGLPTDREQIAAMVLDELARLCGQWASGSDLRSEYRQLSSTLGTPVRIDTDGQLLSGLAVDIAEDGELIVEIDGSPRRFAAGDVTHLRPNGGQR
jgi:BirA family biotin operon repressor/biotin-[acetyl-CoA-carboxylase] ligase